MFDHLLPMEHVMQQLVITNIPMDFLIYNLHLKGPIPFIIVVHFTS